ncbi:TRAP transporter small permease [Sneathiella limimaris]|uniref:TRAP transporter small permease n=1 Tax=Sneathiella limimaris TaxID=1964213 RepID=UPI00146AA104|nr:TRAP transporter small permease subunit [Sneathiella limimaris]
MYRKSFKAIRKICAFGAGFSLATMFAIIFINSVRRYTLGKSFEWGEELPIYLGIYGLMFGAAFAYLDDQHIRFTIVIDRLSEKLKNRIFVVVDILVAITGVALAYSGYLFMIRRGKVEASGLIGPVRRAAEDLSMSWIELFGHMAFWQFSMLLGGILIAIAACYKIPSRLNPKEAAS